MRAGVAATIVVAMMAVVGCGGPGEPVDPDPTQSVQAYFSGIDDTGTLHVHVDWTQDRHNLVLRSPCVPQDNCRIYPLSAEGNNQVGSSTGLPVNLESGSGTFGDPQITFTITTVTGKTFTFSGNVTTAAPRVVVDGTLSGPTHPASHIVLEKVNQ